MRDLRVVPGAETTRRLSTDEEPLLSRQIGERKLVGVQESSGHRAPEPFRVPGVGLLRHGQVAPERRLYRSQNVPAAATHAQKEDMHVTPGCFGPALN